MVGAGRVVRLLPQAYRTVRPIEDVQVWDIDTDQEDLAAASLAYDARRSGAALNRAERPSP